MILDVSKENSALPMMLVVGDVSISTPASLVSKLYVSSKKNNAQQGLPWQLSMQPVSPDWIGLDAARAEVIPLSDKLYRVCHKKEKITNKIILTYCRRILTPPSGSYTTSDTGFR